MNTYIKKNLFSFCIATVPFALGGVLAVFLSFILKQIIDAGNNQDMTSFYACIYLVAVFIFIHFLITLLEKILKAKFIKKVMISLKEDIFKTILSSDINAFQKGNSTKYISIFNNDVKLIETNYFDNIFQMISDISLFTFSLIAVVYLDFMLASIIIFINVVSVFIPLIFVKVMAERQSIYVTQQEKFNIKIKDFLNGFELIKSFDLVQIIFKKFHKAVEESEDAMLKFRYTEGKVSAFSTINSLGISTITSLISVYFVIQGNITIGTMMAIIQLVNNIANPISRISKELSTLKSVKPINKKIEDIISSIENENERLNNLQTISEIKVEHLSFSYNDDESILDDINYVFEKGKKYAIVGESGSGKSTLLKVLLQYYDTYEGSIYFDHANGKSVSKESLYKIISIIHQNVYLFNDSIKNNICLYEEYDNAYIDEVLKEAGLTEVVAGLENGIETVVNENGNNFSGGEKQRFAIARSLIKQLPIVFIDEGTSSLDNKTAKEIDNVILDKEYLTCLAIIHRFNEGSLKKYDEIIVIRNGKIEESGSFYELMEKENYFFQLFNNA